MRQERDVLATLSAKRLPVPAERGVGFVEASPVSQFAEVWCFRGTWMPFVIESLVPGGEYPAALRKAPLIEGCERSAGAIEVGQHRIPKV